VRSAVIACLAGALLLAAPIVHADERDDARAAMRRGSTALERGEPENALAEFESAKRLVPSANAPWFFSAAALTQLGRWREVVTHLETYLEKDPSVSDGAEVRVRIAKIRAERFPARVKVVTNVDADVLVDGAPRGKPGVLEVDPGRHRIEAKAEAHLPASEEIDVRGDTERTVAFDLRPVPPPAVVNRGDEPRPVPGPRAEPAAFSWRTAGILGAGVGAAGFLGMLLVDNGVLGAKIDDYNATTDPRAARDLRSDIEGLKAGLLTGYIVSGILVVSGVAVALLAPGPSTSPSRQRGSVRRFDGYVLRF
jgi:hypothetical protein